VADVLFITLTICLGVVSVAAVARSFFLSRQLSGVLAEKQALQTKLENVHGALVADTATLSERLATVEDARDAERIRRKTVERERDLREAILQSLSVPVWVRGPGLDLVWCNQAYARAVESSVEDVVRRQVELLPTDRRCQNTRALAERASSSGAAQQEEHHVVIGGARHLLNVQVRPLLDINQVVGFALDETGREQVQAELDRHIRAEAEVLENLDTSVAIFGADQRLVFCNQSYRDYWAFDPVFIDSRPSYGEILDDLRERRRTPELVDFLRYKREQAALFTSLIQPREDLWHLPNGSTLWVRIVPHPFGGLMFIMQDVSEKLALESSYNTLIAVQRETLDNLAEGVAVFGSDGRLKLYNPAFRRIWKLQGIDLSLEPHLADLLEARKSLFAHQDRWDDLKRQTVSDTLDRVARAGRLERADGSVIEFSTVPLPDGATLTSSLDVTDTVRVEQALRSSNAALAAADKLKSEFIANVSYQLRTPLNTIMGFAEILTHQYFGDLNDRQTEYAKGIVDASKRLLLLINDVLDLATIEAGRMALRMQPVPVKVLLDEAAGLAAEWAAGQALTLTVKCAPDIGTVEGDDKRLRQALYNLISNAILYTPPGGSITLAAEPAGHFVRVSVIDTGVGIPETDQARIFGRFERSNDHLRQGGAGLGLALVKSFIELHHGHIELSSAPGTGTTVTCVLPTHQPDAETIIAEAAITHVGEAL
jgi:signal transduction histidine kinase